MAMTDKSHFKNHTPPQNDHNHLPIIQDHFCDLLVIFAECLTFAP